MKPSEIYEWLLLQRAKGLTDIEIEKLFEEMIKKEE